MHLTKEIRELGNNTNALEDKMEMTTTVIKNTSKKWPTLRGNWLLMFKQIIAKTWKKISSPLTGIKDCMTTQIIKIGNQDSSIFYPVQISLV